jgi:hypothetical protein
MGGLIRQSAGKQAGITPRSGNISQPNGNALG